MCKDEYVHLARRRAQGVRRADWRWIFRVHREFEKAIPNSVSAGAVIPPAVQRQLASQCYYLRGLSVQHQPHTLDTNWHFKLPHTQASRFTGELVATSQIRWMQIEKKSYHLNNRTRTCRHLDGKKRQLRFFAKLTVILIFRDLTSRCDNNIYMLWFWFVVFSSSCKFNVRNSAPPLTNYFHVRFISATTSADSLRNEFWKKTLRCTERRIPQS